MIVKPCCKNCKIGDIHLENHHALKTHHTISRIEFICREKALAQKCAYCMYNGITGRKAKAYKKIVPGFQTLDYFEPKE